ncbi:MAG: chorismate mutase [candidate division Zixibacteria bacterium]|nr:chorismate mutase [candidate division Zixibacteria bacterium]
MPVRGVRGAVQALSNSPEAISAATQELLRAMMTANDLDEEQIISIFFTTTTDLTADYPAAAARELGWTDVPLLGAQEMDVPNQLSRVIRVLMHVETERTRPQIRHVYLGETAALRPDLSE